MPRIAIVGRPNAGKSSLLNMMAGAKVSIVDPTPGVTRDRVATIIELEHPDGREKGPVKPVELIDTGGFGVYTAEGARYDEVGEDLATLTADIETQIADAIESADIVLFAVDTQAGITPYDREIATLLREGRLGPAARKSQGKKGAGQGTSQKGKGRPKGLASRVRLVATKVDGPKWESHAQELAALGFGQPLMCSAKNNYMRRELQDSLYEALPKPGPPEKIHADLMVAIIGKRNAGKSTLVNALAGAPRMIVSEIAGTTRDAVDVRFEQDGRSVVAIDTAGLRRKKSFQSMVEVYALERAKRAIDRADVVMLMIDATVKLSQVDEQLAMMCQKEFKPVIIVVNKWDSDEGGARGKRTKKGEKVSPSDYENYLREELGGLTYAPIAFMSAKTGLNVKETLDLAFDMQEQARTRVTTGILNRTVRKLFEERPPSDKQGVRVKVYYVAQVGTNPPEIALVVNRPAAVSQSYHRYLINRFREELPFSEVPIKLNVRARRDDADPNEAPIAKSGVVNKKLAAKRGAKNVGPATRTGEKPDGFEPEISESMLADEASEYFDED